MEFDTLRHSRRLRRKFNVKLALSDEGKRKVNALDGGKGKVDNFDVAEGKFDTSVFGGQEVESRLPCYSFGPFFDITFPNHDTLQC